MRNVTRAKMPNLGVTIWRTILNIKLLCVPELLLSHLPKFIEFYVFFTCAFKCYHQKCKLASL